MNPCEAWKWCPIVEISEDDTEYLFKVDLPEVKKEDVKITAADGTLTITGERRLDPGVTRRRLQRVACAYGTFGRSIPLPYDANPARATAVLKDGVLAVHLGKDETAKPRLVELMVA